MPRTVLGAGNRVPILNELTGGQEIWVITKQLVTVVIKVHGSTEEEAYLRCGDKGKVPRGSDN